MDGQIVRNPFIRSWILDPRKEWPELGPFIGWNIQERFFTIGRFTAAQHKKVEVRELVPVRKSGEVSNLEMLGGTQAACPIQ